MNHAQDQLWLVYFNRFIMGLMSQEKSKKIIQQDNDEVFGGGENPGKTKHTFSNVHIPMPCITSNTLGNQFII